MCFRGAAPGTATGDGAQRRQSRLDGGEGPEHVLLPLNGSLCGSLRGSLTWKVVVKAHSMSS